VVGNQDRSLPRVNPLPTHAQATSAPGTEQTTELGSQERVGDAAHGAFEGLAPLSIPRESRPQRAFRVAVAALSPRSLASVARFGVRCLLYGTDKAKFMDWTDDPANEGYRTELREWLNNPTITGAKEEAVKRIAWALATGKYKLDLSFLSLSELPPLTPLKGQLTALILSNNHLTVLPSGIGTLIKLTHLYLAGNRLTTLPREIGNFARLTNLELSFNELESIPSELWGLTELTALGIAFNNLTTLPPGVGNLIKLTRLDLTRSQLTALPSEMGNLIELTQLELDNNVNLTELPLTLGRIPGLTSLNIDNTGIDREVAGAILAQCRALRDESALNGLPTRLATWKAVSKNPVDLSGINDFSDTEKRGINEWLTRLERTKDFQGNQLALAKAVCGMLESAIKNEEFKTSFLTQIGVNNDACEDRAGMAVNELYSLWRLHTLSEEASLQEQLNVVIGAAKTFALRDALAACIDAQQKHLDEMEPQGAPHIIAESVEIFLYYEITLKQQLKLISLIEKMSYARIGKRDWIDEKTLVKTVKATYANKLLSLPAFDAMIEKVPDFKQTWETVSGEFIAKMEELEDNQEQMNENEYLAATKALMTQKEQVRIDLKRRWLKAHGIK